ncbi:hypothetical protein BH11PLA2_BH11PLA2_11630 [soil metagenome]
MSLAVYNLPDDVVQQPRWLDEQLVGDRLGDLIAELAAANNSPPLTVSVRTLLGKYVSAVLERGLSALPAEAVQQLLRQPHHLFELQEMVMIEGGPYWAKLPRPNAFQERVRQSFQKLPLTGTPIVPLSLARPRRLPSAWLVSLATAAVVLVTVFGGMQLMKPPVPTTPVASVGWGWAKPDALPKSTDAKTYLNELANAADEWFKKTPEDSVALAKRINEFRQGCSVLLLADHKALNAEQQSWLKDRCRKWATKFDDSLAKLEAGGSVETVRGEADATAKALVTALRGEAAKL